MTAFFLRLVTVVASLAGLYILGLLIQRLLRSGSESKSEDSSFKARPSFDIEQNKEEIPAEYGTLSDSNRDLATPVTVPVIPDIPLSPEDRRRAQEYLQRTSENKTE